MDHNKMDLRYLYVPSSLSGLLSYVILCAFVLTRTVGNVDDQQPAAGLTLLLHLYTYTGDLWGSDVQFVG
jgi:hypothetical protein